MTDSQDDSSQLVPIIYPTPEQDYELPIQEDGTVDLDLLKITFDSTQRAPQNGCSRIARFAGSKKSTRILSAFDLNTSNPHRHDNS